MIYQAYEQWSSAENAYLRASALEAGRFDWLYYLGVVQQAQSRHTEAAVSLRKAIGLRPASVPARLRLAESLAALNEFAESERAYRDVLQADPGDPEANLGLARALGALGKTDAAVASYETACLLFPWYGPAHYELSAIYRRLGNDQKAAEHLAAFDANRQGAPERHDDLLAAVAELDESSAGLQRRAERMENAGDHSGAVRLLEHAVVVDPANFWVHGDLVWIYTGLGQFQKADAQYRAALALDPKQPRLYVYYAVLKIARLDYDEAERALRHALELNPNYADAFSNLGALARRRGRLEDASRFYREAIARQPDHRRARYELGRVWLELGREPDAEQEFLALIVPATDSFLTLQAIADRYREAGHTEAGLSFARKAFKLAVDRHLVKTQMDLKEIFRGLSQ